MLPAWRSPAGPFPLGPRETPFSTGLRHSCKPHSLPRACVGRGCHPRTYCNCESLQSSPALLVLFKRCSGWTRECGKHPVLPSQCLSAPGEKNSSLSPDPEHLGVLVLQEQWAGTSPQWSRGLDLFLCYYYITCGFSIQVSVHYIT